MPAEQAECLITGARSSWRHASRRRTKHGSNSQLPLHSTTTRLQTNSLPAPRRRHGRRDPRLRPGPAHSRCAAKGHLNCFLSTSWLQAEANNSAKDPKADTAPAALLAGSPRPATSARTRLRIGNGHGVAWCHRARLSRSERIS
jgi:hypothetical protein